MSGSEPGIEADRADDPVRRHLERRPRSVTLWTLWADRSASVTSGSESSPAMTSTRSYGSTDLSPGAGASGSEPSIGAHCTSTIAIGSRLLSASDSRPSTSIRPTRRQSSVSPSNGDARARGGSGGAGASAATAGGALLLPAQEVERHGQSSAFQLFSRMVSTTPASARVVVSPRARPCGDVAEQAAHDLAASGSWAGPA